MRNSFVRLSALCALAVVCLLSSAQATTYYVATTGANSSGCGTQAAPCLTLQYVDDNKPLQGGDVIHVAQGTYNISSMIWTRKSGTSSAHIRWEGDGYNLLTRSWPTKIISSDIRVWYNGGSYVDIVGFELSSSNSAAVHGVNLQAPTRVLYNHIYHIKSDSPGGGVYTGGAASYSEISGNQINDIGTNHCQSSPNAENQAIYVSTSHTTITNNLIFDFAKYGIQVWDGKTGTGNPDYDVVSGNTVFGGCRAFVLGAYNGNVAENNTITNNIFYGSQEYGVIAFNSIGTGNVLDHNNVYGSGTANFYSGNTLAATNTINAAPGFVNYQADGSGDYHLTSGSANKDAGTSNGAPSADFEGTARPQGSAYDVGAYEYYAATPPASISFDPASPYDFGQQAVGTASAVQLITVNNTGSENLTFSQSFGSSFGSPAQFAWGGIGTCSTALPVPPGGTCTISVKFIPQSTGVKNGSFTVYSNAVGSIHTYNLAGTGVSGQTTLQLGANDLAFGNQAVGGVSTAQTVTVANAGSSNFEFSGLILTGDFQFGAGGTCSSSSPILPNDSCTVAVAFMPTATGVRTGTLTISGNASNSPQTVNLSGTGTAAEYSLMLGPGVKINPAVRLAKAVSSQQIPALAQPAASGTTSANFAQAQAAHNLNVVVIGWNDATSSLTNGTCGAPVCDTAGNSYAVAAPTATYSNLGVDLRQAIYYAKDITAATAGNVVTATWDGTPTTPSVRIMEVSGLDRATPFDVYASGGGTASSGSPSLAATSTVATASPVELLVGAGISTSAFSAGGDGYTVGLLGSGGILEYRAVNSVADYAADAWTNGQAQSWLMQLATFRGAGQTIIVPAPAVTAINPQRGPTDQATAVTITGSDFRSGATVTVGGAACGAINVVSDTRIDCVAPAHTAAMVDITVTNPGSEPSTLAGAFTYGVYLTVASSPGGSGRFTSTDGRISCTGSCAVLLNNGYTISVDAAASTGYTFSNWTGCDSVSGVSGVRCTNTMGTADWTSTANFTATNTYLMTVSRLTDGAVSGAGGMVAGQSPHAEIQCGLTCSYAYAAGTQLVLKATPNSGYSFRDWNNSTGHSTCDIPAGDTCTLNVGTAPWTVVANFTTNTGTTANYYVSTTGSDSTGDGSLAKPWATVGQAASIVGGPLAPLGANGATVHIAAGTYRERPILVRNGLPGQPIIFQGEKSGSTYLTIIDGTTAINTTSNPWQTATEIGTGVYKRTFSEKPRVMLLDNKYLFYIADATMDSTNQWLTYASGATFNLGNSNGSCTAVPIWPALRVVFGTKSNGSTYIRFQNSNNPNNETLYAGPDGAVVTLSGVSNITLRDLWIRGGEYDVRFTGAGSNNTIEGNKLTASSAPLAVAGGSGSIVRNNDISFDYYPLGGSCGTGCTVGFGSWEPNNPSTASSCVSQFLYSPMFKHVATESDLSAAYGVLDQGNSSNYEFRNNYIHDTCNGFALGYGAGSDGWDIHENTIENISSTGLGSLYLHKKAYFHDNVVRNANSNVRMTGMFADTYGRTLYVFNNKLWNPPGYGVGFYFHWNASGSTPPHVWVWHNSVAGGGGGVVFSGSNQRTTDINFIDNVFSSSYTGRDSVYAWGGTIMSTASMLGMWGYNWLGKQSSLPWACNSTNKYHSGLNIWPDGTAPSYTIPSSGTGSDAYRTGLSLAVSGSCGGKSYPALMTPTYGYDGPVPYFPGAAPNMGAVQ